MGRWEEKRIDGWKKGCSGRWINRLVNVQKNRRKGDWMDRLIRWMGKQMNGWML